MISSRLISSLDIKKNVLQQPHIQEHLANLHEKFVIVPIDKASNNVAIVCKKYYAEVLLREVGKIGGESTTYVETDKALDEIIHEDLLNVERKGLDVGGAKHSLPLMYWMPKIHKNPVGFRFIVASANCSSKPLSKAISSIFKLIYNQTEHFHRQAKFLSNYNKFWVLDNVTPITDIIKKVNSKSNAKTISTYDFSTLYTTLPHLFNDPSISLNLDFERL